jgi:hypothetical protein
VSTRPTCSETGFPTRQAPFPLKRQPHSHAAHDGAHSGRKSPRRTARPDRHSS